MTLAEAIQAADYSRRSARLSAQYVMAAHYRYIIRHDDGAVLVAADTKLPIETDSLAYAKTALFNAGGHGARIVDRWNWRYDGA